MVALQGTLDSFALTDVLQLVGGAGKVGALEVVIGGHRSALFLDDGTVTSSLIDDAPCDPHETMCWLLRQTSGTFAFHSDARAEVATTSIGVSALVDESTQRNAEMDALLAIVGSLDSWVALNPNPPTDTITVDRARWGRLVTIAGGCTVAQYGTLLDTGDIGALRVVAELMDTGLVTVTESAHFQPVEVDDLQPSPGRRWTDHEPVVVAPGEVQWDADQASPAPEAANESLPEFFAEPAAAADAHALFGEVVDPVVSAAAWDQPSGGESLAAWGAPEPVAAPATAPTTTSAPTAVAEPTNGTAPSAAPDESDLAAFAQEMANLSPQAARAMARAARATTVEERESALAELEEENGHLNRGLILRFLGAIEP